MQDRDLDAILAMAARAAPVPSAGLMDRVLADALALQPVAAGLAPVQPAPPPGLLARLSAMFGGGPVLAGICTAALAGLALGYLNPVTLDSVTGGLTSGLIADDTMDLFPTADFLMTEG